MLQKYARLPFTDWMLICQGICVLNAEEKFLEHLKQLHTDFPKLKIVLEHATTKAAVEMVRSPLSVERKLIIRSNRLEIPLAAQLRYITWLLLSTIGPETVTIFASL